MKKNIQIVVIFCLFFLAYVQAVPQVITFQGRLTESNVPITATRNMRFAIVDSTGTTTYWQSNASNTIPISVNQGIYTINLGDTAISNMAALTPAALDIVNQSYLRVWVAGTLLTPDIPLSSAPYAYLAAKATSANYATTANYAVTANYSTNGVPPGTVQMFAGNVIPTGWLLCDGRAVSRTLYANLYVAITTNYGAGDGSTTFNLPDFQGIFPKGAGTSSKYGTNYTASIGTYSQDKFQGHSHGLTLYEWAGSFSGGGTLYYSRNSNANDGIQPGTPGIGAVVGDGTNGTPRTGLITEPANVGINFIIKY